VNLDRLSNGEKVLGISAIFLYIIIAVVGFVAMLLILLRILDPPTFGTEGLITFEGAVHLPMFLALLSAAGIAFGGCLTVWEENPPGKVEWD